MIHRLIDLSLDHRLLVSILWLALVLAGVRAAFELPIDAVPDITNLQVQVLTDSPGLAPEEVEQFVTFPVETALSGLPRLQEVRSLSKFGLSVVTVVFDEGTDIYWARQQVAERLAEARGDIPAGYGDPVLAPITTGLGEIYHFEIRGEPLCAAGAPDTEACWSAMELRALLDWVVTPQLRTVPGVVEVNAVGGEVRTYQATLDPERLAAYRLGVPDVVEAIRANHLNVGGGTLSYQGEQYVVRGEGRIDTLDDLGTTVVTESGGAPVYLDDLGVMELAPLLRQGAVTRDGEREAVVGIALMLLGENSRTVARAVDRRVSEIAPTLPDGVEIDTFYDRSELVDRTIRTVAGNLLEGSLLVIVVLLLLIGSVRAGLLVALVIPVSMAVAALLMHAAGISGNLMSLGALDFGLIVDGAVVMVDAIVRAFGRQQDTDGEDLSHLSNLSAVETVRRAAHQVARPVVFGVGIVVLVYLPILALRGIEGKMFRPMALTVVFALATALVAALTLVPILSSVFLSKTRVSDPPVYRFLRRLYEPALDWALARRGLVYVGVVLLVVVSFASMPFLGAEFLPNLDEGAIALHIQRLPSISLETSNEVSLLAEQTLLDNFPDEVETIVSRTGRPEVALDPMGVELGDTFVMLHPKDQWSDRFDTKEQLVEAMEEALEREVPGAAYAFTQPIELRFAELIGGVRSDVAIHLYGPDLELLRQKGEEIAAVVGAVPGARDVRAEQIQGLPMLRIEVDRQAIARYGLTAEEVLTAVQAMGGLQVGTVIDGAMRFPLQVRLAEDVRLDPTRIADVRIPVGGSGSGRSGDGQTAMIPLGQLARVWVDEGPAQINRESVSRRIAVEANVRGRDLASFVAEAKEAVASQVELPGGWVLRWGGQFENLEAASERFAFVVPLVLLLIFALLYTAFGSGSLAALVFLNVPVALSGGLFALWIRGYPFSISAAVGFIALFGIAVLNGVVLLDRLRALEREEPELPLREVARLGARSRLRAVLMTASTDIIGFIPMMLAVSAGAEVQRPLATVVVGGLVTATLLTLFVLPALYPRFAPRRPRREELAV